MWFCFYTKDVHNLSVHNINTSNRSYILDCFLKKKFYF